MRRTFQVILIPIESRTLCGSPKTVERCNRMEGRKDYREASERECTRARLARDPRDGRFSSRPPPLPPRASERTSASRCLQNTNRLSAAPLRPPLVLLSRVGPRAIVSSVEL